MLSTWGLAAPNTDCEVGVLRIVAAAILPSGAGMAYGKYSAQVNKVITIVIFLFIFLVQGILIMVTG